MKLSEEMYVKLEPLINCGADVNELDDLKEWLLPKVIELEKESDDLFKELTDIMNKSFNALAMLYEKIDDDTDLSELSEQNAKLHSILQKKVRWYKMGRVYSETHLNNCRMPKDLMYKKTMGVKMRRIEDEIDNTYVEFKIKDGEVYIFDMGFINGGK